MIEKLPQFLTTRFQINPFKIFGFGKKEIFRFFKLATAQIHLRVTPKQRNSLSLFQVRTRRKLSTMPATDTDFDLRVRFLWTLPTHFDSLSPFLSLTLSLYFRCLCFFAAVSSVRLHNWVGFFAIPSCIFWFPLL